MKLDKWQEEFIKTKGDKILCTGRQVGKTEICAHDCGEYVQNPDNPHPVLMTAPTERQAYLLFDKTLAYLMEHYPKTIATKKDKPTKSLITLKSGMRIYCLPTGRFGLGIRGLTIGRSYEDENARVGEEIESAIAPMLLITGGDRIKLSTPFGAQGEFWRTWINKDGVYDSYTRFSCNSEDVMRERPISDTWTELIREKALQKIEQAKARMSKREYAQEYLGQFMDDLFRFFSDKIITENCSLKRPEIIRQDVQHYCGVDIARMGEDEGTQEVIDYISKDNLQHTENIITKKQFTTDTYDKIIALDRQWNFKQIGIDAGAGALGVTIMDFLLRTSIKKKVIAINNLQRMMDSRGEKKKTIMKVDLYNNLLALLEQNRLKLLDDDNVKESLTSVQYEHVMKEGEQTKMRIFGNYTHIAEGLTRAAWLANQKHLNCKISWI